MGPSAIPMKKKREKDTGYEIVTAGAAKCATVPTHMTIPSLKFRQMPALNCHRSSQKCIHVTNLQTPQTTAQGSRPNQQTGHIRGPLPSTQCHGMRPLIPAPWDALGKSGDAIPWPAHQAGRPPTKHLPTVYLQDY